MSRHENLADLSWLLLAALLFSAVGLIGMVTPLSPGAVSFGRSVIAATALGVLVLWQPKASWTPGLRWKTLIAGVGQAGNWSLFFAAIQTAGMDAAVLALFVYPVMTALIEPKLEGTKLRWVELAGAGMVLLGVFTVTPEMKLSNSVFAGILLGLLSAAFLTVRNLVGKQIVPEVGAVRLNLWMCLACIPIFLPFRLFEGQAFSWHEAATVGSLALFFTVAPQVIFFASLKRVSAAWASLVVSSQPVFSILFKAVIFQEPPEARTMIGGCFIMAAVLLVSLFPAPRRHPEPQEA